jgi:acetyl-CoA/propionyl-CoA/long-chain acyl-CoA carboxylase, biotin carboxylase, biotin carboxyl carrier protein
MNTRIQVEHTVTEMVTGLDLVREQIRIALGEPLSLSQDEVELRGHSIECRINAEDPAHGFLPSPGLVTGYREPAGPGVRVDSGVTEGSEISGVYDPLIAKLIVHADNREHARRRMLRALGEFVIEGPATLIGFHEALLSHDCFIGAETCAGLLESGELALKAGSPGSDGRVASTAPRLIENVTVVEVDGRRAELRTFEREAPWRELARRRRSRRHAHALSGTHETIVSPMQGTVLAVAVSEGDEVEAGQVVCIVEAMKMENEVHAVQGGRVTSLSVRAGDPVTTGQVICVLEAG